MSKIPKIGVERTIVEGVRLVDLRKGPGHYPDSHACSMITITHLPLGVLVTPNVAR